MKVLLGDDHQLFLDSFAMVLGAHGHDVVATCRPAEVVAAARSTSPDTCVMDFCSDTRQVEDSDMAGTISDLRRICDATIVILTGSSESIVRRGVRDQAVSVIHKGTCLDVVIRAVERAAAGEVIAAPGHERSLVAPWTEASVASFLTTREREVLEGLVQGKSTAALAAHLGVRPTTARTHVQKLLDKLGVHSRLEAVAFATRHDLVGVR